MRRHAAGAAALAAVGLVIACTQGAELRRTTEVDGPDFQQFKEAVNPYLEVRCGSLDCHGQRGRPLRVYSGRGLRLESDAGNISGGGTGTSADEIYENWLSAVGLEPEHMRRVVEEGGFNPERLMLVTKPRDEVKHKGGRVVSRGDEEGDKCMTSWLAENVDKTACARAADVP